MPALTNALEENLRTLHDYLRIGSSFDIVVRRVRVAEAEGALFYIGGLMKEEMLTAVLYNLAQLQASERQGAADMGVFANRFVPYGDVSLEADVDKLAEAVLSGRAAFVLDGYAQALLVNARSYPARGMTEPETDRALRGAHDGFVESLAVNVSLVRRHIRDVRLTMERVQVGSVSRTDVVMCYLAGVAEQKHVDRLRQKLEAITIPSITMGHESLSECLLRKQQWYNPFPKIRYTERPDAAAATVLEGRILVMIDNYPSAMVLPTAVFDFVQDTNDYYFPPLIGSYLRLIRLMVFTLTVVFTPLWYLLMIEPSKIPEWLSFIRIDNPPTALPILVQLLIVEVMVEVIRMASMNTPAGLASAFGMIGTLIFGEFAVQAGLLRPEILLYMSIVTIANFTQASFELGYAFKLFRIFLVLMVAMLQKWGFVLGMGVMLTVLGTTRTVLDESYLYPLIPFNWDALRRMLSRRLLHRHNVMK